MARTISRVFGQSESFDSELEDLVARIKQSLVEKDDLDVVDRCFDLYKRRDFVLLVAGEVSVGKSSFLNALIGRPVLLTDMTETTAAITYLRSAVQMPGVKADHVRVTYKKDGCQEWIPIGDRERLMRATTSLDGNKVAISTVEKAEVFFSPETLPIPSGVTIIDTPGLNGSTSHSDLTHREMGLCHVAIYLLDATQFGKGTDHQELKRLYKYAPDVVFVVNKWDSVRKAGKSISERKQSDYFPKLAKWSATGLASSENIFVISSKEALLEREAGIAEAGQESSLANAPDNEFLLLENYLTGLMTRSENTRLVRVRPLLTIKNIVRGRLDALTSEIERYVSEDKELEVKIKEETENIRRQMENLESSYDAIRSFAGRLAEIEAKACKGMLSRQEPVLLAAVDEHIAKMPTDRLAERDCPVQIQKQLNHLIEKNLVTPIWRRFSAFSRFVQTLLESQARLCASEGVSVDCAALLQKDISSLKEQKDLVRTQLSQLGTEQHMLLAEMNSLKSQLESVAREIESHESAERKYAKAIEKCDELENEMTELGPRPAATQRCRQTSQPVYETERCGFLWLKKRRKLVGYRTVQTYYLDDSDGLKWDAKSQEIKGRIVAAEERRDKLITNPSEKLSLEQRRESLNRSISIKQHDLEILASKEQSEREKLAKLAPSRLRSSIVERVKREIRGPIREKFLATVSGFKADVEQMLEAYMASKRRDAGEYVAAMSKRERELSNERKAKSERYERLVRAKTELDDILLAIDKLIEKLNGATQKG